MHVSCFIGLTDKLVDHALEDITDPCELGIQLNIEKSKLKMIENDYPLDTKRQKIEVIYFWLRNSKKCTWEALASAVERMGDYGNLVIRLKEKHQEALNTVKQVNH